MFISLFVLSEWPDTSPSSCPRRQSTCCWGPCEIWCHDWSTHQSWLHSSAHSMSLWPDQHDQIPAWTRGFCQCHHQGKQKFLVKNARNAQMGSWEKLDAETMIYKSIENANFGCETRLLETVWFNCNQTRSSHWIAHLTCMIFMIAVFSRPLCIYFRLCWLLGCLSCLLYTFSNRLSIQGSSGGQWRIRAW